MNQCPNAPSPGAGRANRGPWVFFVLLALGVLWGCAVPFGPDGIVSTVEQAAMSGQLVPVKTVTLVGGPRLNHPLHIENDLECSDCHEADAETGEPTMPTWETCTDCHEQPEEGEEPDEDEPVLVGTFFDAEHKPLWKKADRGVRGGDQVPAQVPCEGGGRGRRGVVHEVSRRHEV